MAFTTVKATNIAEGAITTEKISVSVSLGVKISNVSIANSSYTVLDDTAVSTDGGYIVITGSGFSDGAQVLIDQTPATSVTVVNSTTIRAQVPSANAASYNLYVVNSDGSTGIRVNGLTYSGTPTWVTGSTLDNQAVDVAFNIGLDATGAVSYANTSELPSGTALLSNGYFYGTVTGIVEETVYNFTVVAIDAENQDSPRTFSVTVTVGPPAGALYVWGYAADGQLGLPGGNFYVSNRTQLGSDTDWVSVSRSLNRNSGAIKDDGTLWVWGLGSNGKLGLNDLIYRSSPIQVGSLTNWSKLHMSDSFCVALKSDGTAWGWGYNTFGNLGLGNTPNKSSPTQIGTDTNWSDVSASIYNSLFKKTDNSIWSFGWANWGDTGHNDGIARSSPTQIGTDTDWDKIQSTSFGQLAIKTDGTLWTWGSNGNGQLGVGDTVNRSSPTQVGTDTNWVDAKGIFTYGILALKSDGTLWGWGSNSKGQLGLNNVSQYTSPKQIGSDSNWNLITGGYYNSGAIKTNGTLWTWGRNEAYQLGHGDTIYKSSPTQVGSDTTWISLEFSQDGGFGIKTV